MSQHSGPTLSIPEGEQKLQRLGLGLLIVGCIVGTALGALFMAPALLDGACGAMCLGMVLAFPAAAMYLTVPRLLDRYDPEPWYALFGCLVWGGTAAAGFSIAINSTVGAIALSVSGDEQFADIVGAVVSAPITEEFFKAMGIFGVFYFLRREFDGIVDGIIYATFVALGFAAVENILYYGRAAQAGELTGVFIARGILFPWGHPVYTSMTGIGFGLARESEKAWVRRLAPFLGFGGAIMLHAMWNASASFAEASGGIYFVCSLGIWFLFVVCFIILIIVLVRRRGRVIRQFLTDEVALGNLSWAEVELVCDAFGVFKARMRHGRLGMDFVRAAARLALSKWHATRAHREQKYTVSMDFIVPLRQRLKTLRDEFNLRQQQGRR